MMKGKKSTERRIHSFLQFKKTPMKKLLLHPGFPGGAFFALLFLSFFSFKTLFAQEANKTGTVRWNSEPFGQLDFIENKGQFDQMNGAQILFGATGSTVHIFFSAKGLTYRYDEWVPMTEEEKEAYTKHASAQHHKEGEEENLHKLVPRYMHMEWIGANPNVQITSEEKVPYYYTYGSDKNGSTIIANGYRKLLYKNLYPGIDVEYIILTDKP